MYIRLCGTNQIHPKGIKIEQPHGFGDYLFLRLKAPARFLINGQYIDAATDSIILYSKGSHQFYESTESPPYIDDYLFFDVENEEEQAFFEKLPLKFDEVISLPDIRNFMNIHQMICTESIIKSSFQKESLNCLMKYFLIKLSESMNADYSYSNQASLEQLNSLRLAIYSSPSKAWSIKDMAKYVSLSPSYLQSIYKKTFNVSCIADLINARTNYAKELLSTTSIPINKIAEQCGYMTNVYFSRQFKRKIGMTPKEYREEQQYRSDNKIA